MRLKSVADGQQVDIPALLSGLKERRRKIDGASKWILVEGNEGVT